MGYLHAKSLLYLTICLTYITSTIGTLQFEYTQPVCPELVLEDALHPGTAYNIVYQWNRFGKLKNWHFSEANVHNIKQMHCVKEDFQSTLSLPHVFSDYLNNLLFDLHISKNICLKNNVMTELVHVDDVSVISKFQILEVVTKTNDTLTASTTVKYNLPWYLQFLQSTVDQHIRKSLEDKFKVFAQVLCTSKTSI